MPTERRICVYCGARPGSRPEYLDAARAMGRAIAGRGLGLVYGGASIGMMGAVADAALAAGGEVIGVIPTRLFDDEVAHGGLTELIEVESMHERKAKMADLAAGFVALPGGLGTLEEVFEALTWTQIGIHAKPVGLFDVDGYWRHLLAFLDHTVSQGFVGPANRDCIHVESDPDRLLAALDEDGATDRSVPWSRGDS